MRVVYVVPLLAACTGVPAFGSLELAQKNACMACHGIDRKLVGPAFQDVAKKYAGQTDAVNTVAASIRNGGSGKWGPLSMPGAAGLSDADAKALATWVLGTAK